MRRAQCGFEVFARTAAREEKALAQQLAPRFEIDVAPLALDIGREWATLVRSFLPANAEPAQVVISGVCIQAAAAIRIKIFHAHHQRAACVARPLPRGPKSARMAHMQVPCGRGRKPPAITRCPHWRTASHARNKCSNSRLRSI